MISICMIVKDEEASLPRALANWRELADELIVVDTGSTDTTERIAKEHGARLLRYNWQPPGHKGAARMVGINAAQEGWIVVLDADEVIQQPAALREFLLSDQAADLDGLNVRFQNYDAAGAVLFQWSQMRIFRRGRCRYWHREHEIPVPVTDCRAANISTVFEHRPVRTQDAKNPAMIERLLLDVEDRPDDPHPVYFLHRQYALAGQWGEALDWGLVYTRMAKGRGLDRAECYGNMATCHLALGEPELAIQYLHRAAADQPARRLWWIRLAEIYHNHHQFQVALALLRCAAELPVAPESTAWVQTNTSHLYQLIERCQAALATGEHHHG